MKQNLGRWIQVLAVALLATGLAAGCGGKSDAGEGGDGEATPAANSGEQSGDAQDAKGDAKKDGKVGKDGKEKKEEAVPVEVTTLDRGPIEAVLRFSSNIEAESEVQVISEAARKVTRLLVEEGDRVGRNALLLQLEDAEQKSALAKAESQYEKAAREFERQKRLFEQDLISEEAYNNATYELEQLEIALADARRELSYTEVRAPIAGTVTARLVNLGDQIQVGQHLFDIVDFDSLVALVYVPEKNLRELQPGLSARITSQATGADRYTGEIERIAPVVDPRTGTVKVTVDVGRQGNLRPGLYVDVELVTATRQDALLVPKRALVYDNDQMYVFRLGDERRVERVFVEAALTDKHNVQPVEGLNAGDRIVVAGQTGLKDGALVRLPGDEAAGGESGDEKGEDVDVSANETGQQARL